MTLRQKQGVILLLMVVGLVLALWHPNVVVMAMGAVSYTHLTLPTNSLV